MLVVARKQPKGKSVQTIIFTDELIKRIDNYRYAQHIPTRAEAIRYLIEYALQHNPEPPGQGE